MRGRLSVTDLRSLTTEVIKDFIAIDPETQMRNLAAWQPVVTDILEGVNAFEVSAVSICTQHDPSIKLRLISGSSKPTCRRTTRSSPICCLRTCQWSCAGRCGAIYAKLERSKGS